jgi:hypothetical protein
VENPPVPVIGGSGGTLFAQGPPPPAPTAVAVAPQVEAYDELQYKGKADDTFAKISQQFFQSDRYAKALQMHNRNHPRATEGILHDPPQLEGQQVFIPPLRILEKNYGSLIPDFKPLPAMAPPPLTPGAPPASSTPPGTALMPGPGASAAPAPPAAPIPAVAAPPVSPVPTGPAPIAPGPPTPGTPPTGPTTAAPPGTPAGPVAGTSMSSPAAEKQYRVGPNGETYRDIAARTLGNRDRWGDIYNLNGRRYPPEYPVPANTILRMPADARMQ